jgi:hypothetical protein
VPSGVYAADLNVAFSQTLTSFSILCAPQELACDSSARMRVTAYMDATLVGTATTNASAGTWPSETLAFASPQGFNRVVVHYDAPPPTGGDYGPIFVADNMAVTPMPTPTPFVLGIACPGGQIQVAWPTNAVGLALQANTNLLTTNSWSSVTNAPETIGSQMVVTLPVADVRDSFYRLKRP